LLKSLEVCLLVMTKSVINVAGSKSTVLVVEDCGDDAELIRVAFHKAGFEHLFQTFSDVEEARRYLTGQGRYADRDKFPRPDLVLLDHQMPGDGTAIVRWGKGAARAGGLAYRGVQWVR
jgi:CheY-like chemotaxis protein